MQPLSGFDQTARQRIRYVLTDIDDTLTDNGRLHAPAYAALERLHEAGFTVVPVTGRPAGWCDLIARQWPVDAVVGENGALYMRYDQRAQKMHRRFWQDDELRRDSRERLRQLAVQILQSVPGAALASDQAYRECDLAIDYCEDVPRLDETAVNAIVALFNRAGATAKISSIHVNGWFGDWDKLGMTRQLFAEQFAVSLDEIRHQVVFVGDSPNDQPMFAYFPQSVGVANVRHFAAHLTEPPRWITDNTGGTGFAELAEALLAAR